MNLAYLDKVAERRNTKLIVSISLRVQVRVHNRSSFLLYPDNKLAEVLKMEFVNTVVSLFRPHIQKAKLEETKTKS